MFNNIIMLKGLVSIINDLSAEMRKIEAAGTSRSDLMSTLKVLGADMTYLIGHAAPAVANSTVNTPVPAPVTASSTKITIYTDGSFKDGAYGWAYAIYDGKKLIHKENGGGTEPELIKTRNVAGELKAVMKAMAWCRHNLNDSDKVTVAYDYKGIENWVLGTWQAKSEVAQKYVAFMAPFKGGVTFKKVAAHTGVDGNELVDKLAKEAVAAVLASKQPAVPVEEAVPAAEEIVFDLPPVPQEDSAPAEESPTSVKKKMTTAEFNSQEPDLDKQKFIDNMAVAFGNVMDSKEVEDF